MNVCQPLDCSKVRHYRTIVKPGYYSPRPSVVSPQPPRCLLFFIVVIRVRLVCFFEVIVIFDEGATRYGPTWILFMLLR